MIVLHCFLAVESPDFRIPLLMGCSVTPLLLHSLSSAFTYAKELTSLACTPAAAVCVRSPSEHKEHNEVLVLH